MIEQNKSQPSEPTDSSQTEYKEWTKHDMLDHAQKLALNADENTSMERLREMLEQASPLN